MGTATVRVKKRAVVAAVAAVKRVGKCILGVVVF
jgi:hypothetical protein